MSVSDSQVKFDSIRNHSSHKMWTQKSHSVLENWFNSLNESALT